MIDGAAIMLSAINALVDVYKTVHANKHAARVLLDDWTTLGAQLSDLHAVGPIGGAQRTPFAKLLALAEETKAFLQLFSERSKFARYLTYASDRDCFRELVERLAVEVASLELGLMIDAKSTLLQIEKAHARDMSELLDLLTALHAASTQTAAQNEQIQVSLDAVLAHLIGDAKPRAEAATLAQRMQAETPTIKVRRRPRARAPSSRVQCAVDRRPVRS
jgi:hypothetical protein